MSGWSALLFPLLPFMGEGVPTPAQIVGHTGKPDLYDIHVIRDGKLERTIRAIGAPTVHPGGSFTYRDAATNKKVVGYVVVSTVVIKRHAAPDPARIPQPQVKMEVHVGPPRRVFLPPVKADKPYVRPQSGLILSGRPQSVRPQPKPQAFPTPRRPLEAKLTTEKKRK
ncbi:MAG TPA: hypothetical protein VGE52_07195 [Pirellulales bacterium]